MITDTAPACAPDKTEWSAEIHTPDQTYNANVPIDLIERDPANRVPTQDTVWALAATIKIEGLLQPIVLRQLADGRYRIIAGETRWCAFRYLSRETIPAFIRKGEADAAGDTAKRLVENLSRTDISPIAEARGFKLLSEQGRTQKQIGELFGRSQPVVANAIRVLALPNSIIDKIEAGALAMAHGVSLARFARWPQAVRMIAERIGPSGWSAKNLDAEPLPFALHLEAAGVAYVIATPGAYFYPPRPVYSIPAEIKTDVNFVEGGRGKPSYYLVPDKREDDKWGPEADRQDALRKKQEANLKQKEAADKQSGKLTQDQIERKRTLEKNKRIRVENAASLGVALEKLARTPAPTATLLAIVVAESIAGGYSHKRIQDAATSLGVTLPKGLADVDNMGHGMHKLELMAKMDPMVLLRVAVAVILGKQVDDASKLAQHAPEGVEMVVNSKVPSGAPAPADLGTIVEFERDPQRRAILAKQASSKKNGGSK
jgi:ParB/RepB/Spo0J family partition protein